MHKYTFLIALFILMPSLGFCSNSDWQWSFDHWIYVGTDSTASDASDYKDIPMGVEPWIFHLATYKESGIDGWNGLTGFYRQDFRAPLDLTPGNSLTWRIYMWADTALDPKEKYIGLSWSSNNVSTEALQNIEYRLTYVRSAIGLVDTMNTVGEYKIFNDWPDGSGWAFPACRVENPLDGYILDFTATVVPEPSSVLALTGGLAGLAGLVLNRKRQG